MNLVDRAETVARAAHAGQVRKWTGEEYAAHPARVVGILRQHLPDASDDVIAAAWLHDVVEDTAVDLDAIEQSFGAVTSALVWELTKPNTISTGTSFAIKACDLLDNLGNIAEAAPADDAMAYLLAKRDQVLQICERLKYPLPDLAYQLAATWLRNWEQVKP